MSALKIPTQFPWVVAAVVVAHGILAIFLFGGTGEATRQPRSIAKDITAAKTETAAPSAAAHLLGKTGSATAVTSETLPPKSGTYGEADNADFEPRFPKRIPRQSELNAAIAATDGPVTAQDIFEIAEAKNNSVPDAGPKPPSEKKGSSILSLPSAVAAAKAAPSSNKNIASVEPSATEVSSNRIRIVKRTVPVSLPIAPTPEVVRAEPVAETSSEPTLRFKTSLPSISKIKPIERIQQPAAAQPRHVNQPPTAPQAQPSNQRQFRVVKPLPR